jgi:hypothetical protein
VPNGGQAAGAGGCYFGSEKRFAGGIPRVGVGSIGKGGKRMSWVGSVGFWRESAAARVLGQ